MQRKYRRINRNSTSVLQAYQIVLMACGFATLLLALSFILWKASLQVAFLNFTTDFF
ncbi:hypothetical protein [Lactobacillus sp. UCMA15818]|uniref:hypothetical protein n=1 Tax=Lactobacillus sp. UCMA15818 TaxID=2583394 RepID=UPI0025B08CAA|nr:hypothetical protein [Lactobacillus sp. UCMA15818]